MVTTVTDDRRRERSRRPRKERAMRGPSRIGWLLAGCLLLSGPVLAGDWLRFRGPNGSGIAEVESLPQQLSAEQALWKVDVLPGESSPIVVGSTVILTGLAGDELATVALDAETGVERWRRTVPRLRVDRIAAESGPTIATPTSDGSSVFVFFPELGLIAYGLDGTERWRLELPPFASYFGMAGSPVLEGGVLVLVCDQTRKPFLLGVDATTGKELWRRDREVMAESWTTPVVHRPGTDGASILIFGNSFLDAYAPRTGERRWRLDGMGYSPVASPVVEGDLAFMVVPDQSGYAPTVGTIFELDTNRNGSLSETELARSDTMGTFFAWLDLDGNGGIGRDEYVEQYEKMANPDFGLFGVEIGASGAKVRWRESKSLPYIATPILYRDVLFTITDGGILTSFNPASGAVLKRDRIKGAAEPFTPSPVAAAGKLYLTSSNGTIAVVAAKAQWETLSVGELDEPIEASPAIGDGRLFVRTSTKLYAFGPAG
jgi:outer membrane protein assembly factor BamB